MKRWRRLLTLALAGVAIVLLLGTVAALRPPHIRVAPERSRIDGVTVINPGRDRRPDQSITLRGDRIESIADAVPAAQRLPRDRLYEHGYALPGLIDLDVRRLPRREHLRRLFGVWFLAAGVTTVRVSGGLDADLPALQRGIAAAEFPWPRLVACGALLVGEGASCAGARVVRAPAEAAAAVAALAADGAPCVAAHRSLSAPVLAALREAAAARGLPVVGDGVFDGARLVGMATPAPPGRAVADWLRGWPAFADGGAAVPLPVGGVQRWNWLAQPGEAPTVPQADLLPRFYRDVVWPRQRAAARSSSAGDLTAAEAQQAATAMLQTLRRRHDAGGAIRLGSATPGAYLVPGTSLWMEMSHLASAGLPLEDLWVAATREAGAALGIDKLGSLEPGAPADLLIFRDDPTRDLAALTSLRAVVTRGRLYPARILNGDMLEYARYAQRPLYDWLTMLAARTGLLDESGDPECDPL